MRDLESIGIMPVKKAYIKFMIKSLIPPEAAHAMENIQTQPNSLGPNPNINTTIRFSM
jgi:hypothetical protein